MPLYQVSYKVNSRSYNTDIEAKNIDAVKTLFKKLSVGHITEIKEYVYFGTVSNFDTNPKYHKYASAKIYFDDHYPYSIKVPKFKVGKKHNDLIDYLSLMYPQNTYISVYSST